MSDLSSLGWTTIFCTNNKGVDLPEELTRKWWDKKKQVTAGATGMGEALDELKKAFAHIKWFSLSPNPECFKVDCEAAEKFVKSSEVKAFVTELKAVALVAKNHAPGLKKSLTAKKTGELLEDIGKLAKTLIDISEPSGLEDALEAAIKDWNEQIRMKFVKLGTPVLNGIDGVNKKIPAKYKSIVEALKSYLSNPLPQSEKEADHIKIGVEIRQLSRDMTTQLGNLLKMDGVPLVNFDAQKTAILFKKLAVYGNGEAVDFMAGLSTTGTTLLVNDINNMSKAFTALTKDIAIA